MNSAQENFLYLKNRKQWTVERIRGGGGGGIAIFCSLTDTSNQVLFRRCASFRPEVRRFPGWRQMFGGGLNFTVVSLRGLFVHVLPVRRKCFVPCCVP